MNNITCRVPLRISLAGGGTDVEPFITMHGSTIVATTINLYVETKLIPNTGEGINIYSIDTQTQIYIKEGQHDSTLLKSILTACLTKIPLVKRTGFSLEVYSPVPARSGLGASSAIILSILGAIYSHLNVSFNTTTIAIDAYEIERNLLMIPGGCQDQHVCAVGGFNTFNFSNYKKVIHHEMALPKDFPNIFENSTLLVWSGISRNSDLAIVDVERQNIPALMMQKELVSDIIKCLTEKNFVDLGNALNQAWKLKREVTNLISNPRIDSIYKIGLENGALGGKLLGAGGGGFFFFVAEPSNILNLKLIFGSKGFLVYPFKISKSGIEVINH
jgi:D-glycero-alpha-D-manno-heptose-7-phosphate kinase